MALAVETPAREDMSLRTNDDKVVGARWLKSDAATPMVITAAVLTLRGDPPRIAFDPDTGDPLPPVAPAEHRITSTTPGDPAGWINAEGLAAGVVLVTVPHGIWATFLESAGDWDIVADGEGVRRCLVRGRWYTEQGVST
jgi:hypothetical protein